MSDTDFNNPGVKAAITLGTLALIGVMAVVISKAVQVCLKKDYTADNDSEISENTRELIRARLSVIQFRKRERQKAQKVRTVNIFHKWGDIVKNRKRNRDAALQPQKSQGNDQVVITIHKLDGVKESGAIESENNTIQEIRSPTLERCSSFTQAKSAGGAANPHLEVSPTIPPNEATSHRPTTPNRASVLPSRPSSHRPTTPNRASVLPSRPTSHRPTTPNRASVLPSRPTSHRLTTPNRASVLPSRPTSHRPTTPNRASVLPSRPTSHRPTTPNKVSPSITLIPTNVAPPRETTTSPVPRGHKVTSKQHVPSTITLTNVDINDVAKCHIQYVHFEDYVSDAKTNVDIENKSGENT